MNAVLDYLVTDGSATGEYLERFLKSARERFGFQYGAAFRSPVSAFAAALETMGLQAGSSIAIPALAPAYCLRVLEQKKIRPVFLDHDLSSGSVILTALRNQECDLSALYLYEPLGSLPVADDLEKLGIPVIEDISTSFGAKNEAFQAGTIGSLVMYSLEYGSHVTTGGGQLLYSCSKREGLALKNRIESIAVEEIMTDYNAALGWAQIKNLDTALEKRRSMHSLFRTAISGTHHVEYGGGDARDRGLWAFPVVLASSLRDVQAYAKKKDIETRAAFDTSVIASGAVPDGQCSNARSLYLRTLLFPLHERISSAEADRISKVLASLP